jgi:hypothetical protein
MDFSNLAAIAVQYDRGDWTLRASTQRDEYTSVANVPTPVGMMRAEGGGESKFHSVGARYDNGRALVMAERIRRIQQSDASLLGPASEQAMDAWYASFGWRFGNWMPVYTHSEAKPRGITDPVHTDSVGLRWDARRNMAIKLDYAIIQGHNVAVLRDVVPADTGRDFKVLTLGVDFVF